VLFWLVFLPVFARAQAAVGSIEIGGGAGYFLGGSFAPGSTQITDQKAKADDNVLRGCFWLGAQLSQDWGVEVLISGTSTNLIESRGGVFPTEATLAGLEVTTIDAMGLRSFRRGNFLPYLGFGAGVTNLNPEPTDLTVHDTNRPAFSAAAGARFYAARWVGMRIDLRGRATYLGKRRVGFDQGWADSGRRFFSGDLLTGLFLSFGGR
jgi:hypothetical protein